MLSPVSENRRPWTIHLTFMLASTIACIAWSWWAGRDLNWDQLNYHLYVAYHYVGDRVEQDFMGASIQGYLNPLAYLPFYFMVKANWHSLLIGSTLALLHSTCLWMIYGISRVLIPRGTPYRTFAIAASVAFAFLAPLFLVEVGSTFIDVTTTVPALAGVLLLMYCQERKGSHLLIIVAGLMLGTATALKFTNVIFALAAAAFIALANRSVRERVYDFAGYAAGGIAALILLEGAWAYRLFRVFGNPLFPWFNGWFKSPDFPLFTIRHTRFMPETAGGYLLFPVRMLDLDERIYTETIAPDIRLLGLSCILLAAGIGIVIRRVKHGAVAAVADAPPAVPARNSYRAALAFTLISYVLWLASSGNGRYAMPLLLFVGPMIPASVLALSGSRRVLVYLLGLLLLVQATMDQTGAGSRWMPTRWKSAWYDIDLPETLRARPFLFLSLNKQTNAFLAPFLNPDSSFVNLVGQVSLALDRPGGARLGSLLDRHRPNIRTLVVPTIPVRNGKLHPSVISFQNRLLKRVLLEVDQSDCISFEMHDMAGLSAQALGEAATSNIGPPSETTTLLSCATKALQNLRETPQFAERRARANAAFDLLEKTCPRLFSPAGAYTDHVNEKLRRDYVNTDAYVWELGGVIEYQGWRYDEPVTLGRVDDILDGKVQIDCSFARAPPVVVRK